LSEWQSKSCEGSASTPISADGVDGLRKLVLRTLNDNQLLVLKELANNDQSLTSLLHRLSRENGIPLSTLKLNARILRELGLISYGSIRDRRPARLERLGVFVQRLLWGESERASLELVYQS